MEFLHISPIYLYFLKSTDVSSKKYLLSITTKILHFVLRIATNTPDFIKVFTHT
jgi:hypothetical protein